MRKPKMLIRYVLAASTALGPLTVVAPMNVQAAVSPIAGPASLGLDSVQGKSADQVETILAILGDLDRLSALEPSFGEIEEASSESTLEDELIEVVAQAGQKKRTSKKKSTQTKSGKASAPGRAGTQAPRRVADPRAAMIKREEDRGRQAVRRGDYFEASKIFFGLLEKEKNPLRLLQIRFILGRTLQELKLHQVSAFPYYEIIRSEGKTNPKNKYVRQSLERLTVAADQLESDILLNYAVKQINEEDFPASNRDMLFFRRGEVRSRDGDFVEAAKEFNRVRSTSIFYNRARYQIALSLVEAGQLEKAENVYAALAEVSSDAGVTNKVRVNAMMGKARTLYQRKLFAEAIDSYREIPRDTEQWHDALFESTWALLQDGRFRSALSNFHSLHSPFYDDFYQPESLLLRAIVYHYICRYDEMETTLRLFERVYGPVSRELRSTLMSTSPSSAVSLYREVRKIDESFEELKKTAKAKRQSQSQVPFLVAKQVLREGDVRRNLSYIRNLEMERKKIDQAPATWRESRVGRYARRVVERRIDATQAATGRLIRRHLERIQVELSGHFEQSSLIRLDMLSGKKESVKKEIVGKGLLRDTVDDQQDRNFYIQNGYDFWPFKGEYWLDEIGNYHYLGVKACE
ncbi:MAG: tetratricopeptide repeat protein [Deltaproteobacteria bacterium]|jgi:tetratricopeptide (TPR) repeat protein|nr:tetratricopeptide repeat protein [Deltaproteobacteria bacterium]